MTEKVTLPEWASFAEDGAVVVDRTLAYPLYLEKLEVEVDKATQLDLEIARWCFTADLYDLFLAAGDKLSHVRLSGGIETWALKAWPVVEDLEGRTWREFKGRYRHLTPLANGEAIVNRVLADLKARRDPILPKHPRIRGACEALIRG